MRMMPKQLIESRHWPRRVFAEERAMRHFDGPPPIHGLTPREREREYIGRNAGSQGLLARIDGLISIDAKKSTRWRDEESVAMELRRYFHPTPRSGIDYRARWMERD